MRGLPFAATAFLAFGLGSAACKSTTTSSQEKEEIAPGGQAGGSSNIIPTTWYHAGSKATMMKNISDSVIAKTKNIRDGAIGKEDWDKYIMGNNTRFSLPPWRRGFYGAESVMHAMIYMDDYFRSKKSDISNNPTKVLPWLLLVHVNPACVAPGHVFDPGGATIDLSHSELALWLEEHFKDGGYANYEAMSKDCIRNRSQKQKDGSFKKVLSFDPGDQFAVDEETGCMKLMQAYIVEKKFDVIVDRGELGPPDGSWYVRERSCIEEFSGTADELFRIMQDAAFWASSMPQPALGSIIQLSQVLAEAKTLTATGLDRVATAIKSANLQERSDMKDLDKALAQLIAVASTCVEAGKVNSLQKSMVAFSQSFLAKSGPVGNDDGEIVAYDQVAAVNCQ